VNKSFRFCGRFFLERWRALPTSPWWLRRTGRASFETFALGELHSSGRAPWFLKMSIILVTMFWTGARPEGPQPVSKDAPWARQGFEKSKFCFQEFSDSFLRHYEFSPEGRYVHEYHPFLLQKTAQSFDELEATLRHEGFNLVGRMIISGYEEHAVPSYYTNYKAPRINDEASTKGLAGWSIKLHNRFGFMTGYLFKDVNHLAPAGNTEAAIFEHIDAHTVPIFDPRAIIFQEHAFGEALRLMDKASESVMKKVHTGDSRAVLEDLMKFWQVMYFDALKVGNKQVAGTQDILFSIDYAKYLMRSKLPLLKYFTGPDITYPIEVSSKQEKGATLHAQAFVRRFTQKLVPINNKNTVYIFSSFVDGVGKSTTLGNIKNWMRHGDDISNFEHVDNSSSQLAEIFQFKDKVYIADLPAQVSHFTYKPDGFVFVDARTEYSQEVLSKISAYAQANRKELKESFDAVLDQARTIVKDQGYFAQELYDKQKPDYAFARNLVLLKKTKSNPWVPLVFEGKNYLFNYIRHHEIRCLTTLSKVKSDGLKTIESEQMLFFDGIRFPLPFPSFTQHLVDQLKINSIENVVLVDFTSMYPRSSRENIRVNYLVQQMALLDPLFDVAHSLYKNFVHGGELLYTIVNKRIRARMHESLSLETTMRALLCKLIVEREHGDITGLSVPHLTSLLKKAYAELSPGDHEQVRELVVKKVLSEGKKLERIYGNAKQFVNIQQFSLSRACALSKVLQSFFTHHVENEHLLSLWGDYGDLLDPNGDIVDGRCDIKFLTTKGLTLGACYKLDPACKDEQLLTPLLRVLRSCWYAGVANIINGTPDKDGKIVVPHEKYYVGPAFLQTATDQKIYLVQDSYEPLEHEVKRAYLAQYSPFNLTYGTSECFGQWEDKPYRLDWQSFGTNSGLYAYHCSLESNSRAVEDVTAITIFVQKYQNEEGTSKVMPTAQVLAKIKDSRYWKYEWEDCVEAAKKNGPYKKIKENAKGEKEKTIIGAGERKIFLGNPDQRYVVQTLARVLATIDMIVKDPDSDIIIRYGNREDFKAALKLFEKITLPKSFGLLFTKNLFDDYTIVEPYPSWEYWDSFAE